MNQLFAVIFFAAFATVLGLRGPCVTDAECRKDECCALSFTGQGMECREMGEKVGEACGSPYLCSSCYKNLTCTLINATTLTSGQETDGAQGADLVEGATPTLEQPILFKGSMHSAGHEGQQWSNCPHPASSTCQNITATPVDVVKTSEGFRPKVVVADQSYHQDL